MTIVIVTAIADTDDHDAHTCNDHAYDMGLRPRGRSHPALELSRASRKPHPHAQYTMFMFMICYYVVVSYNV